MLKPGISGFGLLHAHTQTPIYIYIYLYIYICVCVNVCVCVKNTLVNGQIMYVIYSKYIFIHFFYQDHYNAFGFTEKTIYFLYQYGINIPNLFLTFLDSHISICYN